MHFSFLGNKFLPNFVNVSQKWSMSHANPYLKLKHAFSK